jgi:hypothetical protein
LKELNVYGTGLKEKTKMKHGAMKAQIPEKTSDMWPNSPKEKSGSDIVQRRGNRTTRK